MPTKTQQIALLLQGRTPATLASLRLVNTMPPLREGRTYKNTSFPQLPPPAFPEPGSPDHGDSNGGWMAPRSDGASTTAATGVHGSGGKHRAGGGGRLASSAEVESPLPPPPLQPRGLPAHQAAALASLVSPAAAAPLAASSSRSPQQQQQEQEQQQQQRRLFPHQGQTAAASGASLPPRSRSPAGAAAASPAVRASVAAASVAAAAAAGASRLSDCGSDGSDLARAGSGSRGGAGGVLRGVRPRSGLLQRASSDQPRGGRRSSLGSPGAFRRCFKSPVSSLPLFLPNESSCDQEPGGRGCKRSVQHSCSSVRSRQMTAQWIVHCLHLNAPQPLPSPRQAVRPLPTLEWVGAVASCHAGMKCSPRLDPAMTSACVARCSSCSSLAARGLRRTSALYLCLLPSAAPVLADV